MSSDYVRLLTGNLRFPVMTKELRSFEPLALSEDERLTGASRLGRLEDPEAESGAVQVVNDSPAVVETV